MSRSDGKSPKLDLKLNLSRGPPSTGRSADEDSPHRRSSSSSSPSSCMSSEAGADSPEAASMVLGACPRCLMYVMLAEEEPKCPKCNSPVLLNFLHGYDTTTKNTRKS